MPIQIQDKERRLPLHEFLIEGTQSGLTEDLKFRPNKYFHPVETVEVIADEVILAYTKPLGPVTGMLSIEQIHHVLLGAIDGMQRVAHDQIFYLFPGVEAFGLDRRQTLRIGLINVRPLADRDRKPQDLCVDAFLHLIAHACPEAQKKIVAYNKPILTLRHLKQVLEGFPSSSWFLLSLLVLVLLGGSVALLHEFGPPQIRSALRRWTASSFQATKRIFRSGTDEWFAQLGEERRQREYRFPPFPVTLILQPKTESPQQRQALYAFLIKLLDEEIPDKKYKLSLPYKELDEQGFTRWQELCKNPLINNCQAQSWLLELPEYKGGFRPLFEAIKEAMQKRTPKDPSVSVSFLRSFAILDLSLQAAPPPPTPPTPPASPASPTSPTSPASPSDPRKTEAPASPSDPKKAEAPTSPSR